jgi:hypothetical protein
MGVTPKKPMTTKTEKRLSEIESMLLKLVEEREKPSRIGVATLRRLWKWGKPYIIPFILGMLFGQLVSLPFTFTPQPVIEQRTTLEQQAALGGAVIPFPSGNSSPMLSTSPPKNSEGYEPPTESTASMWKKVSEPLLPSNPQADTGQTNSQKSFRRTLLRTR